MKSTITQLFTIAFLFVSFSGITQTSLEGKMTDAKTGEPIIFGTVALYKNDILISGKETALDGIYHFTNIVPGNYDVEGSYIGYTSIRQVNVIIKSDIRNQLDLSLNEGALLDAVQIVEYKVPLIESDDTISEAEITTERIRSLPSKSADVMATMVVKSKATSTTYYMDGIKVSGMLPTNGHKAYRSSNTSEGNFPIPKSGQITASEWNDLHNWKDWMTLMEDEEYRIMTERFEIYPTQRYSVIVINDDNSVIPNIPVKLIDNEDKVVWKTLTDNAGKAELWGQPFESKEAEKPYNILVDGKKIDNSKTIDRGSNTVTIKQDCTPVTKMDIVFTVDATSSMSDEIHFLKSEILDVIDRIQETNENIEYRTGSVFYRDVRDEYLTRISPLSHNKDNIVDFVAKQNASGGGDKPEAVEKALEETLSLNWDEDALKLVFLILDAPPHEDDATMRKIRSQIKDAAAKGIKLIPITASGIGRETEFLMKFMAMMTNGTYVFITDDSGIGEAHLAPIVTDYEVEKLNDCIVRLITQYSKSYSCSRDYASTEDLKVNIYPNPSTQYINIETPFTPTKINILASNGKLVKTVKPANKSTRIELEDLVNGVYTAVIYIGETVLTRQIILLK